MLATLDPLLKSACVANLLPAGCCATNLPFCTLIHSLLLLLPPTPLYPHHQGQQREQKRKQMSVADKAMYSMGSLVYQSAAGRLFTFGYLVVLHLLVFLTLTHMTHRTSTHLEAHQELALSSISRHDLTGALHGTFATTAAEAAASPLTQAPAGLGQLAPPPPPPP